MLFLFLPVSPWQIFLPLALVTLVEGGKKSPIQILGLSSPVPMYSRWDWNQPLPPSPSPPQPSPAQPTEAWGLGERGGGKVATRGQGAPPHVSGRCVLHEAGKLCPSDLRPGVPQGGGVPSLQIRQAGHGQMWGAVSTGQQAWGLSVSPSAVEFGGLESQSPPY